MPHPVVVQQESAFADYPHVCGRERLKIRSLVAVLLSLFLVVELAPAAQAEDVPPRRIISGWMPYWSTKDGLSTITTNNDLVAEATPFWFSVKSPSQIIDQYEPLNATPMLTTIATLKSSGVKVLATFTDGTGKLAMQGIMKDATKRATLIATLVQTATDFGFDGIDLDWEGFAFSDGTSSWATTQPLWTNFIQELSNALHARKLMLSVTTPELRDPATGKRGYWVYDWAGIAPHIDRLRIMTYDYSINRVGPIGPLTWTENAVKYAISLMPASKVFVGAAAYGRDWVTGLTGTCPTTAKLVAQTATVNGTRATVLASDAANLAKSYGATPTYNTTYGEATFTYKKVYAGKDAAGNATSCTATRTVWYQNARSILDRAKLVGKHRIAGVAIWYLGEEEAGTWGPVRAYAQTIAPDKVKATLAGPTTITPYGQSFSLKGTLAIADGRPVADSDVVLQSQKLGETSWTDLGTAKTAADGSVSFDVIAGAPRTFRLFSAATWERYEGTSEPTSVAVRRLVTRKAPLTARRRVTFAITGQITPAAANVSITLQVYRSGTWRTLRSVPTTEAGAYRVTTTPAYAGPTLYRVIVAPAGGYAKTISKTVTVAVR